MPKRIIYHIGDISRPGGMERIIVLKANWLAEHGYQVTMLSMSGFVESFFPLSSKVKMEALDVFQGSVYDEKRNLWGALKSVYYSIRSRIDHKRKVEKYLESHSCDYFITLVNRGFIPKLKDGSKKYFEIHFSSQAKIEFHQLNSFFYNLVYDLGMYYQERICRRYDKFIVLTEKDRLMRGNIPNMIVIPNFITIESSDSMPVAESRKVIAVGRLSIEKGFDYLFQAWAMVSSKYPDWSLEIYGYGYGREEYYNELIQKNGVEESVKICAPVKDIRNKYLDSAFYVMSSRYEGFPLTLGEAMSCGLPCISYNCNCGPSEIIRHGEDGILVDKVGDVEGLANAMLYMIEHPVERLEMGENAKENIKRFSIDNVMRKWEDILQ